MRPFEIGNKPGGNMAMLPTWTCRHASLLLVLALSLDAWVARAELQHVDLAAQKGWVLTNANGSIRLPAVVPAHTLSVLASAGVVAEDPLYRYGEVDTRWVAGEAWSFTLVWPGHKHEALAGCRQVALLLHGIDTFGSVVLNGQHVLEPHNAHRAWWVPVNVSQHLREGANMLSVVLQPAADAANRAKAAYPYPVPTMQVPRGAGPYNFVRKPAFDFGWDWGPAFVPAGISGGVELVGWDRATLIGALVTQEFNSSSDTFVLRVTGHFVVPLGGDSGRFSVTLAALDLQEQQQVTLQPGEVAGNPLQALATLQLLVPAGAVDRWQPLGQAPKGAPRSLYDVAVMFDPDGDAPEKNGGGEGGGCGAAAVVQGSSGSGSGSGGGSGGGRRQGAGALGGDPAPLSSTIVRRVGFRTVELVQQPMPAAAAELLQQQQTPLQQQQHQQQKQQERPHGTNASAPAGQAGESFYFRVNGAPLYAKGANLIPAHVLSTGVGPAEVERLLQAAVDANMNMVRVWGGGTYPVDELYEAADELGLLVWQEAMFSCSPYPRHGAFLANVEAEVTQQLLRLGSHASLAVFGGNNEVEQSLEWFEESRANTAAYALDYTATFVDTIGRVVQQMLPVPWVDSSPSKGTLWLQDRPSEDKAAGTGAVPLKRWGNTNDPAYGDIHFYNYLADCQDWRTYPAARFVSEFGWQSYPSWSTYAAATAADDWHLTADMSEYRQRHPNGTIELLAQLQRRFRLPEAWLELLPQQRQQQQQQQQQPQQQQQQDQRGAAGPGSSLQVDAAAQASSHVAWRAWALLRHRLSAAATALGLPVPGAGDANTSSGSSRASSAAATGSKQTHAGPQGLAVGRAGPAVTRSRRCSSHTSSSTAVQPGSSCPDMQAFVFLTQVQQMLCYETALHRWRRLRSEPSTLSMGVLYWQLNDVWAGASWSSVDYSGVWKPVHYGVARAFADVALSVQHDLEEGRITVHVVNDQPQEQRVTLLLRLLSLADTAAVCGSGTASSDDALGSSHFERLAAAPYAKYSRTVEVAAGAAAATQLWSEAASKLVAAAGTGACSEASCYLHLLLTAEGQAQQEATVWLAPFRDLALRDPGLALSGFHLVPPEPRFFASDAAAGGAAAASSTGQDHAAPGTAADADGAGGAGGGAGSSARRLLGQHAHDQVAFTVSSQAVAVFAVWETSGLQPWGHFSDNAATVHPCEPRNVTFVPHPAQRLPFLRPGNDGARRAAAAAGSSSSSEGGRADGQNGHGAASSSGSSSSSAGPAGDQPGGGRVFLGAAGAQVSGKHLLALLEQELVVTSLWDYQQPDGGEQGGELEQQQQRQQRDAHLAVA